MALSSQSRQILRKIKQIGRQQGATPKEIKAAIETGLVESSLTNPTGGTADSAGWRQERKGLYPNPTNVDASIKRFFDETKAVRGKYGSSGDLAAAVQRPAAAYRGRYAQQSGKAQQLLGNYGFGSSGSDLTARTTTTPGVDRSVQRGALISQFLDRKGSDVLDFALGIRASQDTPGTSTTTTSPGTSGAGGGLVARANAIDAKKLPYQWGGGHAGKVDPAKAIPLDCSGAVSAVLGIDPRVSGDFTKFGKPGEGGKVTVYANAQHVLMKIRGQDGTYHFFGTSASNPGGGAGWIKASQISRGYLKNFTARHI